MKKKKAKPNYDLPHKNPESWRGTFYYNPKDSRILLPRNYTYRGLPLNFGNLFTYLVLIGLTVFVIAINIIL